MAKLHPPILRLTFSLFLLLGLSLDAQSANNQRFTPVRQLQLQQREVLQTAIDSTIRIDSINGRCSATRIHSRGDLLTARHCVQGCLIREKVYQTKVDPESVEYYVLDSSRLGKAECSIAVNGVEEAMIVQYVSPYLIDRFSEQALKMLNRKLYEQLRLDGALSSGDFAILSPKNSRMEKELGQDNQDKQKICLSDEEVPQDVFTLGFPSETKRSSFNSDGVEMFFSSGKRLNSFSEGVCYQEAQEKHRKGLLAQFDEPGTFVSTVDAIYGSSGSVVYGNSHSIVGILTNMYAPYDRNPEKLPEVHFCSGAAKALQSKRILQLIGPEAAKLYRCEGAAQE